MSTIERLPAASPDYHAEAITKLKELFPEVVADGKIDFESLKQILAGGVQNLLM